MIYRYIYKITCTSGTFKDKFYFGQRITRKPPENDNYKGSGRKLRDYYKKYPNDYIKEIISFHNSDEELNQAEYDIIHSWLNNDMCLNLMEGGGSSGLASIETKKKLSDSHKGKKESEETRKKKSEVFKGNKHGFKIGHKINEGRIWSESSLIKLSESHKGKQSPFKGKHHTEESRKKISESHKGKIGSNKGKHWSEETKNKISKTLSGSKWMSNTITRIYVKPQNFDEFLQLGFHFGMK